MARLNVFSHVVAGKDPTDRALDNGYDCRAYFDDGSYTYGLGENIYKYPRVTNWSGISSSSSGRYVWTPDEYTKDEREMGYELVKGWMESPGHRANILDKDYRRMGVGVHNDLGSKYGYIDEYIYATQNFSSCE